MTIDMGDFINRENTPRGYAVQDVLTSLWRGKQSETIRQIVVADLERTARQWNWNEEPLRIQERDYFLYDPEGIEEPIPLTQISAIFKTTSVTK